MYWFVCLFVCFLTCLFFIILIILEHPQEYTLNILWRSNLIWLRYIGSKNVYLFVCLFVCLCICLFFCFNHSGTPTESSPENFVNIRLDFAEILRIRKLYWKCLFVFFCLLIDLFVFCLNHLGTPTEIYPKNFVKIRLDLAEIFRI